MRNFRTGNNQELSVKQEDGSEKIVVWPPNLAYCETSVVELIRNRIKKESVTIAENDFIDIVITQEKLWNLLIEEKFIDEKVTWKNTIRIGQQDDDTNLVSRLPEELTVYKTALINWLKENDGNEFSTAITSLDSECSERNKGLLENFLQDEEKKLKLVEECFSQIIQLDHLEPTNEVSKLYQMIETLPETLQIYRHLLTEWVVINSAQRGDEVSRETLPCPKESAKSVRKLWNHLLDQGIIEDRVVIFSNEDDHDSVERWLEKIKKELDSISTIENICFKPSRNRRPEQVKWSEVTFENISSYVIQHPKEIRKGPTIFKILSGMDKSQDSSEETVLVKKDIIEWVTKSKEKEQLDSYITRLARTLANSVGQLKTIPYITATFRPLTEYFSTDFGRSLHSKEIQDFQNQIYDQVIVLKRDESFRWSWRAFAVAMIGIAQIVTGVAITVYSLGILSLLGKGLINEGIGDMIFAILAGISGHFTWRSYGIHKTFSVALTVFTVGIGAYFSRGAMAIKAAQYGLESELGVSLLLATVKKSLIKCSQAVLSAMSTLGINKFLSWLKQFILEHVLSHIKGIIGTIFSAPFQSLFETIESIWNQMKENGRTISDTIKLIDDSISSPHQSESKTSWLNELKSKAKTLASGMVNSYREACKDMSSSCNGNISKINKLFSFEEGSWLGKVVPIAQNLYSFAETAASVGKMLNDIPQYVDNVNQRLIESKERLKKMEVLESIEVESDREKLDNYKITIRKQIEADIIKNVLDEVTNAWMQPWLQNKIESMSVSLGEISINHIFSRFEDKLETVILKSPTNDDSTIKNENGNKKMQQRKESTKAVAAVKHLQEQIGDDACHFERDQEGNVVVFPQPYEQFIQNLGTNGFKCKSLEEQIVADALGFSHEDYAIADSPSSLKFGKLKSIHYSEDCSGKIDYKAIAKSYSYKEDELLNFIKAHALSNKRARHLFDCKINAALNKDF